MFNKIFHLAFFLLAIFIFATCGEEESTSPQSPCPQPPEGVEALVVEEFTNKEVYKAEEPVVILLRVKNTGDKPVTLHFLSGQVYDFLVKTEDESEIIWQWSKGMVFTDALVDLEIKAGEELIYSENWNQKDDAGEQVEAGTYVIEGKIVSEPPITATPVQVRIEKE